MPSHPTPREMHRNGVFHPHLLCGSGTLTYMRYPCKLCSIENLHQRQKHYPVCVCVWGGGGGGRGVG